MNETGLNEIKKSEALQSLGRYNNQYVMERLLNSTFYADDYRNDSRLNNQVDMSCICRAYNITQYHKGKRENQIVNRYKKYKDIPEMAEYFCQLIQQYPNGFKDEEPTMDEMLEDYYIQLTQGAQEQAYDEDEEYEEEYSDWDDMSGNWNNSRKNSGLNNLGASLSNSFKNRGKGYNAQNIDFKYILAIIAIILIFIFRKQLLTLAVEIAPFIITLFIIFLFFKFLFGGGLSFGARKSSGRKKSRGSRKGGANLNPDFSIPSIIFCIIFMYIGIGGMQNGGSPIIGGIFCLFGLGCIFKPKR